MKKTFPLEDPKHAAPRVVAGIKSDVRKYLKRERRKKLPEDVDFWDFDCRIGADEANAKTAHVEELVPGIDAAAKEGLGAVYIEILAKPGYRNRRPAKKKEAGEESDGGSVATAESE